MRSLNDRKKVKITWIVIHLFPGNFFYLLRIFMKNTVNARRFIFHHYFFIIYCQSRRIIVKGTVIYTSVGLEMLLAVLKLCLIIFLVKVLNDENGGNEISSSWISTIITFIKTHFMRLFRSSKKSLFALRGSK